MSDSSSSSKPVDLNDPSLVDEMVDLEDPKDESETLPPCEFITGAAGCGKTYSVRVRSEEDRAWGLICATTGIAAVNLGVTTLHSALGLHPDSVEDDFLSGKIQRMLHRIATQYRNLIIDEVSMLAGREMLDFLYQAAKKANEFKDVKRALGIILVGDFCQLPPIKSSWAFEAECWSFFEKGTTRLTKNYRQSEGGFLDALNALRSGDGPRGASAMVQAGVHFDRQLDPNFDGTVIVGKNDEVDRYNWLRYSRLKTPEVRYRSDRWGKLRSEWKNIPDFLGMKDGAYVMILTNDTSRDPETKRPLFRWVNGDCGHVRILGPSSIGIELVRTGETHLIPFVERDNASKLAPEGYEDDELQRAKDDGTELPCGSYWNKEKRLWVIGSIRYMPMRLAYATTVHKSQGLTLDRVQIDIRHSFLGMPAMAYVATSRCRTADGLHIAGDLGMLARRTKIDPKVARWL